MSELTAVTFVSKVNTLIKVVENGTNSIAG